MNTLTTHNRPQYAITLTYKCNWNCDYCAVRNSVDWKDDVSDYDVFKKIDAVENGSVVTLFGGEPGVLNRSQVESFIERLQSKGCSLKLETNGLFIRRFPDIIDTFQEITYHCSQDLLPTDDIININHKNVKYMLVIHDKNIPNLESFLNSHPFPDKFYMVEATYPHEITGPTLSKQNKNRLLTRFSNRMSKEAIYRLIHGFDFDSIIFLT